MRIRDIMKLGQGGQGIHPTLYDDTDVLSLSRQDVLAMPELCGVKNRHEEYVGCVDKHTVIFFTEQCGGWLLGQILDVCQDAVIAVDTSSRIFYVNEAYTTVLGVPKHKVLGKMMQRIEPEAALLQVCATGEAILEKTIHIKTLNRDVVVNLYPIKRDGTTVAAVSFFRDVTETRRLNQALCKAQGLVEYFREQVRSHEGSAGALAIGNSQVFTKMIAQASIVAQTDVPVLVLGENGVGKEILAKIIHSGSKRRAKPLISVNCAAIPENLLESELFGYEGGSFTGAKKNGKPGKFELAEGGTLFLDEIGDMPPLMQSKILRVLQEKELEKIGRTQTIPVDVRIIAATNRPLDAMVRQGSFRNDLYYRLNVVSLRVPPLRERGEDIALLAQHFLSLCHAKYNTYPAFSPEVLRFFADYNWPGNVRELQNCVEYAAIMCSGKEIGLGDLSPHICEPMQHAGPLVENVPAASASLRNECRLAEKEAILKALEACNNNRSKAMQMLGVSRRTFYRKLKEAQVFTLKR